MAALLLTSALAGRAAADDGEICANDSGDVAIAACTRAIESGKYQGHSLATKYNNRGVEWKLKRDYDRALADYGDAIRIDAKYADAYYNRCSVYVDKNDYDQAITNCNEAIKLGPSPDALTVTGGVRLGNDRTLSDYFAKRGLAYFGKKDYDRAIADYGEAIRLNPKNASAINNRGLAYQAKGDTARANADFARAKQLGR